MKNSVSIFVGAVVLLFAALVFAGPVLAGEHGGRRAGDYASGTAQSKIYGTIEKLPQDLVGTWVVKGREIVVTKDTVIKEKHGKPEIGAYVEAEGSVAGNTFTADEIEVKRSK